MTIPAKRFVLPSRTLATRRRMQPRRCVPMHELSIMQSAVEIALEQAMLAGASRVTVLRLQIGALAGVVPEALEFACDAVTRGTPAEGARLEIETVPATNWCRTCQREFPCDDFFAECPLCRTECAEVRRGKELQLSSLEVC